MENLEDKTRKHKIKNFDFTQFVEDYMHPIIVGVSITNGLFWGALFNINYNTRDSLIFGAFSGGITYLISRAKWDGLSNNSKNSNKSIKHSHKYH
jgi:uncharacterized membrane protein